MSPAAHLANLLGEALPKYRVTGYQETVDDVPRPTVLVWVDTVRRPAQRTSDRLELDTRIQVLVGQGLTDTDDARLWDALGAVTDVLDRLSFIEWTHAERGVRDERWPVYTIHAGMAGTKRED